MPSERPRRSQASDLASELTFSEKVQSSVQERSEPVTRVQRLVAELLHLKFARYPHSLCELYVNFQEVVDVLSSEGKKQGGCTATK